MLKAFISRFIVSIPTDGSREKLLGCVALEPLYTALVGEVLYGEIVETGFESIAIGAGSHHSHHDRMVIGHPSVAHKGVSHVVEGVEHLNGIEASHSLNPDKRHRAVEGDYAPVAGVVLRLYFPSTNSIPALM